MAKRSGGQILALDGLRGCAIALVFVFHLFGFRPVHGRLASLIVGRLTGSFWCGVDLFFVLSGFLITGLLLDARGEPGSLRRFWIRRALRIFPLYYAALLVCFVVLRGPLAGAPGYGETAGAQGFYWAYLQNWRVAAWGHFTPFDPLRAFWSLAVEEQFYLLWPLVVLGVARKRLVPVCLSLIGLASALRIALWLLPGDHGLAVYVLTPTRMDALLAGALVAVWARAPEGLAPLRGYARAAMAVSLLGLGVLLARGSLWITGRGAQIAGFPLLWLFAAALLVLILTAPEGSRLRRALEAAPMRWLGRVSYGLYVVHLAVFNGLEALAPHLPRWAFFLAAASFSGLAAQALWTLIERPFLRLKDRFAEPARPRIPAPQG